MVLCLTAWISSSGLTLAVGGSAPARVIVSHVFSEEGGGHLVLDVRGGNTVRLGWSAFAGSADLPVSRSFPIRAVDASFPHGEGD